MKVCGNPRLSKSIGAIFPITFAHLVCLCYILVILSIFQTSSALLLYLFRWAIISDLWCYYSPKTQMMVSSLGNKIFLIKLYTFFRHNAITPNRLQTYGMWRNYFMETKTILSSLHCGDLTKLKYLKFYLQFKSLDSVLWRKYSEFKICFRNTKTLLLQSSL